jgi:molybdate transport system ATP-binding protein
MSIAPLVQLDRVDVDLAGATVLRAITWRLARGEHWGIVGANGSGKSTFLGLIGGTIWPAPGRGERHYDFGQGELRDAVQARAEIVVVSHELQDRYARWGWNFTALDVVLSGAYRTDVPRRRPEAGERGHSLTMMSDLGVAHLAERRFLELSRGEQRRVLIARGVAFKPTVLLLDEPASGLDRDARIELDRLIARITVDLTLVCTAHSKDDLPAAIEHVALLERGAIVSAGRRLGLALSNDDRVKHAQGAWFASETVGSAASTARRAVRRASADIVSKRTEAHDHLPLVEIRGADVWLGARHVLRDLSWQLHTNQQWLVTGANGSGKSTFLRLLHGQLRPALGSEVRWPALGNPRNVWTLRRQVAWLSPELQAAYRYPTTVRGCIASGFESSVGLTRATSADEAHRVDELVEEFALDALAERPLSSLSYGQARRALIARALANRPRLLLLDEPWEGLDAPGSSALDDALRAVIAEGTQLVCASHLNTHRNQFTHELVLDRGRVVRAAALAASVGGG